MDKSSYTSNYKVRIADSGGNGFLKLPSLLQMLQEIATEHAEVLGVDFKTISNDGLGWALSKIYLQINELPKWGTRVYIQTWPSDKEKISTFREFIARNEAGDILFEARSQWLLFDLNTRRIARMDRLADFPRLTDKYACSHNKEEILERPHSPQTPYTTENSHSAGQCDIDLNGHVNNTVYMAWAIDTIPSEFYATKTPKWVKISFLEEIMPREKVDSVCKILDDITMHSIIKAESNRECARINIGWQ